MTYKYYLSSGLSVSAFFIKTHSYLISSPSFAYYKLNQPSPIRTFLQLLNLDNSIFVTFPALDMQISTSVVALAIIGFTSALPAAIIPATANITSTAIAPASATSTSCTVPEPIACGDSTSCTAPAPERCQCTGSCPSVDPPETPNAPACKKPCTSSSCSDPERPSNPEKVQTPGPVDPPKSRDNTIKPCVTSQYDVWTGAVRRDEKKGKIFKDGRTTDITTLLTFNFPQESKDKTCTFHFDLSSDPAAEVSGSGQFDVYMSLAPATKSSTEWPSGNLRDQYIGRMAAKPRGAAIWSSGALVLGQGFPCPAGETYGAELVGVGDADRVEWLAGTAGPYISW